MRRSMGRAKRRIALLTAAVFLMSFAVPSGAVASTGTTKSGFPLSWLTDLLTTGPAWSATAALVGLPMQEQRKPRDAGHYVPAGATRAGVGAGRAPEPMAGTLPAYRPHQPATPQSTTPVAEPGFDAKTSRRVKDKSSANTEVYANADGSFTRRTYNRPVNYRAPDGSWQPIDSNLEKRADGRLHTKANGLKASVAGGPAPRGSRPAGAAGADAAAQANAELATLTLPTGEAIGYRLDGANPVTPIVDGSKATYPGILPHTDLELVASDVAVKETMILKSPDAPSSWVFPLRLSGLTPRLTETGSVELLNTAGKAVAWFPNGFMQDSKVDPRSGAPAESPNVKFELIQHGGATALKVVADQAWLRDPARVYPVRADPTATTGTTGDVYVDNESSTSNHNGDNLPVGTYNGGTTKARSFIHLDEFDENGFLGKRFSAASLKLYHTWSYDCTSHKPFSVHRVNAKWTVANLSTASHPGPAISDPIGSLAIGNNSPACSNDEANRSVGRWVSVPLNVATFNDWSSGDPNYGLALTASETDSTAWKRFTSANYGSGQYKPYVELTYTNNVAPQINVRYPANNAVLPTLTPELLARGHDPDAWPAKGLTYNFVVLDTNAAVVASSGWTASGAWTVPAGKLAWNKTYVYSVQAFDKAGYSAVAPGYAFRTSVPQPALTSSLAQNSGKGYDASIGNYTTSATDASVASVGPSLAITRSYNSLDTRRDSAFGTGWSSVLDVRATQVPDVNGSVQSVRITYPTGQEVAFGRNADGSFTAPSGRFAILQEVKTGTAVTGYTLTDKDASVYTFKQAVGQGSFRVTSIADANGRALTATYDATGNLNRLTGAGGRSLQLTWATPAGSTRPHVTQVSTDPVVPDKADSVDTWQYTYGPDDRLTKVCQPGQPAACWTYAHDTTSQYSNVVLNEGPYSYWRLAEPAGATAAASAVLANAGTDNGRFNNVTLGAAAGLAGSTATAAGFNGTSSFVQLPGNLVADGQYQSLSMWFKTGTPNGVLFSYSADNVTKGTTAGNYVPALYIGADGKLRGQFWQGAAKPITTDVAVTDDAWHHVVLAGAGATQTLYLDGVAKGTLAGTIDQLPNGAANVHVGAGFMGGTWPGHAKSGAAPAVPSHFQGSISDVAFFNEALTGSAISTLREAGITRHPVLSKVVRPSGGVTAEITYHKGTGKVETVTDASGGTWKMGTPTVSGNSDVYAAAVLGGKPADYWRLGEVETTDAVNEVQGDTASYNEVTLGSAGPFADSKAASFNGTSSYLELPASDVPKTGPNSIELWFKHPAGNTKGGVLFGYQAAPLADPAVAGNWTPALYVGVDGKLRGGLWTGTSANVITASGAAVNDGKWHHVVLAASNNAQTLYLDGVAVGSKNAAVVGTDATHAYVGAGKWSGNWASHGTPDVGYFPGSIAEVAVYQSQLSQDQVGAHFQASRQTAPVAVTMVEGVATAIPMPVSTVSVTGPKDERLTYSYDLVNGNRMVAQTDALGNETKFGYDVGGYSSLVYDPRGVWTQNLQDVRGNTRQTISCQDQATNKCSSVYYTYFPDATTTSLSPDARNDLLLTMRDGRSASATDNTYLTSYGYDTKGNRTTITDALGRVTTTTYTDGTTVAAKDGGFAPAGLPATVTTPGGARQTVVYYASGDVAEITDPAGKVIRYSYDGLGRPLTETEITDTFPNGLVSTYTYDRVGRPLTETEPATTNRVTGAVHTPRTTMVYDLDGNVLEEIVADLTGGDAARVEKHTYNAYGQEVTNTTAAGATSRFEYDVYGRVVKETEPDGGVTRNTYDAEGNLLTSTVVGYTGDPNDPSPPRDLLVSSKAYDPAGRLASETDAMGWTTEYSYTDNGLEAKTTRSDGTNTFVVEENTYDAAGNVVKVVTNNGATTVATTYDAVDRQTSSTVDPAGLKRATTFGYDRDDNVVSATQRDAAGAIVGRGETMYNADGQVIAETTYPSTGLTPVNRWRLSETSGTRARDSAGNNPATATAGVSWTTNRGGAAAFTGAGSAIESVGPTVDTAQSFSVSAWVSLANNGELRKAVSASGDQQSAFDLAYDKAANKWRFRTMAEDTKDSQSGITVTSTSVPAVNTWTHLTGVLDATTGTAQLYVDGKLEGTKTGAKGFTATGPMLIGAGIFNGFRGNYWPGEISDVQAYQKALTLAEVGQIRAGTAPDPAAKVIRTSQRVNRDGQVTASTDANGNTTYVAYDEDGNAVKTTAPAALAETATEGAVMANAISWTGYNTFGEVTDTKDANGNWSVTGYDADGRVVSQRSPSYRAPGSSTSITPEIINEYDIAGQLTSVTDPKQNTTKYAYDQLNRLSSVTAANGGVTKYRYDLLGDLLSVTDPTGAVTASTYDYLGRKLTETDAVRQSGTNHTTTYTYGVGGWVSSVKSPTNVTTSTTYNAVGEPLTVKDGANNTTTYAYDGAGRTIRTTLPDNTSTAVNYDLAGRATRTTWHNAAGKELRAESTEYDPAGNVVASTDGRATTTRFEYDATGALVRETQPISASDSIVTSFGYDLEGNRTRFTDGRGNEFWTTYNAWGMPESQIEPATTAHPSPADRTFTTTYDAAGRPIKQALPGGVTITSSYDEMGDLRKQEGDGAEASTDTRAFEYDLGGRLTSFSAPGGKNILSYDDRDLPLSVKGPSGDAEFSYNPDGQLDSRKDAAGTTSYGYDGAGRLATLSNPTADVRHTYDYNKLSQVSKITYGMSGNTRNFAFDELHRPVVDELKTPAGATIGKIGYDWDLNDNIVTKTTSGFTGAATNTYTYDLADRLTSWKSGNTSTAYAYDKSGNRVQNGAKLFSYDQRNRLVTGDGVAYSYTPRGTLAQAGGQKTTADAFGQVITQEGGPAAGSGSARPKQTYRYDALGRVLRDNFSYTGLTNDLAGDGTATYVRGPSGELVGESAGGSNRLAWTDLHTDVVAQFTATGTALAGSTTYDPLGKVLSTVSMLGNLGYQSEWTDAVTSRVNMHARWFNQDTGQFDTRDTVANSPVPASINANRYQYGDGNPLTVTDPTGHWGNPFKKIARAFSSARATVSSTWNRATSYVSSYTSRAYSYARKQVHKATKAVKKAVRKVTKKVAKTWNKVKSYAKKKYNQAKRYVKKKYNQARKWVAQKYAKAKQKVKHKYNQLKQAGKKVAAKAIRHVQKAASVVRDAASATKKWVVEHKDTILEVAAIAGAIAAGLACTAVTAGVGAVACMVGAGALINLAKDAAQGDIHSFGDALGSMGTGALSGLIGGAGGMIAGKIGAAVAGKIGTGIGARLATESVENGVEEVFNQAVTTGRVNLKSALAGMVPGLSLLNRKGGGGKADAPQGNAFGINVGGGGGGCSTSRGAKHSFDPATPVVMADGKTTQPIKDVKLDDKVLATDPVTGTSTAQRVTELHRNLDTLLSNVTVVDKDKNTTTLQTTQNHPFWNESEGKWTEAKDLQEKTKLRTRDHGAPPGPSAEPKDEVTVVTVDNFDGVKEMLDITVEYVHTYHVMAGDDPVLVHNCGGGKDANGVSCSCPSPRPATWDLDAIDYPASAIHAGQAGGHGRTFTLNRPGADANREQSLAGIPTVPQMDRDEFPPAVFAEGGRGASVQHIPYGDNRGAGSTMKNQLRDIPDGGRVVVRIHNLDVIGVRGDPSP